MYGQLCPGCGVIVCRELSKHSRVSHVTCLLVSLRATINQTHDSPAEFLEDANEFLGGVSKYKLSQFLQGRKCEMVFRLGLERFVPCVVGRRLYKKRLRIFPKKDSALFTASDEAFMLLLLENSWSRWLDIYHNAPDDSTSSRTGCLQPRKWKFVSDEPTLYTTGGIRYMHGKESRSTNGWTSEGIKRYNELFRMVKRDRAERPGVFKEWVEELFESNDADLGKRREVGVNLSSHETPIESDLFNELGVAPYGDKSVSDSSSEEQSGVEGSWGGDLCGSDDDDSDNSVSSGHSNVSDDSE